MTIDILIGIILSVISILILFKMCKGNSCDYKTRIRVYCAIHTDGEILFVDTLRKNVVKYIEDVCDEYKEYKKKDIGIKIRYMSKLTYSLMRGI